MAWAGLDKVAPTEDAAVEHLVASRENLETRSADVSRRLDESRAQLRGALAAERATARPASRPSRLVTGLSAEVAQLRTEQAQLSELLDGVARAVAGPLAKEPVHAHLRRRALPDDGTARAPGRLLRAWAAASASLTVGALGVLLLHGDASLAAALWVAAGMLVVEALLRRRFLTVALGALAAATAFAALLSAASIVLGSIRLGFGILLLLIAGYLGVTTVREVLRQR